MEFLSQLCHIPAVYLVYIFMPYFDTYSIGGKKNKTLKIHIEDPGAELCTE